MNHWHEAHYCARQIKGSRGQARWLYIRRMFDSMRAALSEDQP